MILKDKEFDMKLPRLIALHYGLAAILMGATLNSYAETPKKDMIKAQQKESKNAIDAAQKATPDMEARPAATTSQTEHSIQSPKGDMIKDQKKAADKAIDNTQATTPVNEGRPAAATN
jgi:hypothetical protein